MALQKPFVMLFDETGLPHRLAVDSLTLWVKHRDGLSCV